MSRILVAYFSAKGTTGSVAERLAKAPQCDLFEIRPKVPYTQADLTFMNPKARCNKEKKETDLPLDELVENFGQYDRIALGFPVWFGGVPSIVKSFAKNYDWKGKRVGLFMTSGWGAIGNIQEEMEPFLEGAIIKGVKEFAVNAPEMDIRGWLRRI